MLNPMSKPDIKLFMKTLGHERGDLLLRVLMRTGARTHELFKTKPSDLFDGYWLIRRGKGSRCDKVPLLDLFEPFQKAVMSSGGLLGIMSPDGIPVRHTSACRLLRRHWEQRRYDLYSTRGSSYSLHDLRATFGQNIYEKTHDPIMVQSAMGHKSLDSTGRYLRAFNAVDLSKLVI